jgi:DNA segregation ATPase FtsK/SpoIIIE-like protein
MVQHKRRKLLWLPAAAVLTLLVLPRAGAVRAHLQTAPQTGASAADDPLLDAAAAWVDHLRQRGQTHLFYPVSRLQREFRIGYGRTCALVDSLARRGDWTIGFSGDGTRYARIHSRGPA